MKEEEEGKTSNNRKRKLDSENHQDKRSKMNLDSNAEGQVQDSDVEDVLSIGLLLRSAMVGKLIGKAGKTINNIRKMSGANVRIKKQCPQVLERTAEVIGLPTDVSHALEMIASRTLNNETQLPTLTLLVESLNIGCVIGKKGAKITKIRNETEAHVLISSQCIGESTQKTITITGSAESVSKAIRSVVKHLANGHQPVRVPFEPRGSMQPEFLPSHDFRISRPFASGGMYSERHARGVPCGYPSSNRQWFHQNRRAGFSNAVDERIMNVPVSSMGMIIGKGGSRIREIRERSGAKIQIADTDAGSSERKITITGSSSSVGFAVNMLQQLLSACSWDFPQMPRSPSYL